MPYAQRDAQGNLVALHAQPTPQATEWVDVTTEEVRQFVGLDHVPPISNEIIEHLSSSDMQMVRVLEDLLEVLIANKVILFTDLPMPAQVKLLERRSARRRLGNDDQNLVLNDDNQFLL